MLLIATLGAGAQSQSKDAMVVETKGGERVEFYFDQKPEMTFQDEYVNIAAGEQTVQYAMADVTRVYFQEGTGTGVSSAKAESVRFFFGGDQLRAEGLTPGTQVSVYTVGGTLAAKAGAGSDGTATLSTAGLSKGVYLVKANKVSYKFVKK